ncbi:MAG: heat-inducible transcriptional repressor HrcA [Oscillospiraceae bacterium]
MTDTTLDGRKMLILSVVVERYIQSGEPVGSKYVAQIMNNSVSSATIRNDMAALEEAGLLEQPHASAGRIPTHHGYRIYIDQLMHAQPLTMRERAEIDALFNVRNADPDQLLEDAATSLAGLTRLATISTTMIPTTVTVRRIEIIPAGPRTVVILLIVSSGVIKNKVCRVDFDVNDAIVDFFVKFVNSRLQGHSLDEITSSYISAVNVSLGEYARVFVPVLASVYELVREINNGQYFTKGTTNLLEYEELSSMAYDLLSFIEKRHEMLRLVLQNENPTSVMIGREAAAVELADSSVLIARYHIGDSAVGAIGVIGPVRMDYARLLPHLEYFAQTLGKLLSDTYTER